MTRVAIAQVPMHWDIPANLAAMKIAMRTAKDAGARLCAFAELAVTGFHRRVPEWTQPALIGPAVSEVQAEAARLGLAVAFGAPGFGADGARLNSHLFVDADGTLAAAVHKIGLTEPEATFFARGRDRPVARIGGLDCTAVICREIEDASTIVPALAGRGAQIVLWPGQMRPDPAKPVQDPPEHVVQAQALARALGAFVVQTNWPNALNRPEESAGSGRSACISPAGELLFRLPEQGFGTAVFTLGDRHFDWHPHPA